MLGASPSETYTQILYIEIIVQKLTSTKYLRSTWRNQHQPQHLQPEVKLRPCFPSKPSARRPSDWNQHIAGAEEEFGKGGFARWVDHRCDGRRLTATKGVKIQHPGEEIPHTHQLIWRISHYLQGLDYIQTVVVWVFVPSTVSFLVAGVLGVGG